MDLCAEKFDPEKIKMPFQSWIFENDAEKVAIEKVFLHERLADGSIPRYLKRSKMEP